MSTYDPERHHRRTVRIHGHDYACGWFFVTICTINRDRLLGTVQDGQVNLSAFGHLCEVFWREIPIHFPKVDLDAFIIMPNHIHGVIGIKDSIDVSKTAVHESFRSPATGSLATIIRSFKSAATRSINDVRETPGSPVWQKGFYEHIVRNERDLIRIRSYIELNPSNWTQDPENVDASG